MPKNENYIHISGWMVNELGLKGNELLVYALIYGFSQDAESEFRGTAQYIADWLNSSKRNVLRTLSDMTEKGLLIKRDIEIAKNLKLSYYSAMSPAVTKCHRGGDKMSPGGGDKMSPNNTNNINTIKNTNSIVRPTIEQVREYCAERGKGVDPDKWFDYYSSNGWKVGKNPMKDWKAAVRTWERNGYASVKQTAQTPQNRFNNFEQRNYDYAELEQQLLAAQRGGTS